MVRFITFVVLLICIYINNIYLNITTFYQKNIPQQLNVKEFDLYHHVHLGLHLSLAMIGSLTFDHTLQQNVKQFDYQE